MHYRALAFDLDGTLLLPDERVSERNLAAVTRARLAGLQIIVATARWFALANDAVAQLNTAGALAGLEPITGPAVACSGALVRRLGDGVDLLDLRLPAEFVAELYARCDAMRCLAWARVDDDVLVKKDGPKIDLPHGMRRVPSLAASADRAAQMVLVQGGDACQSLEDSLGPVWGERVRFVESFSSSGKRILTLTATGADKGVALGVACAEIGIDPRDVVAFGDAENDLEMFAIAGRSFAMGQAGPSVRAAATDVTASNLDDGVAVAIEALLLER